MALGKALKSMYKDYKTYTIKAKQQGNYCKENYSFDKMKEKLEQILNSNVVAAPKQVPLQLPKLKKIGNHNKPELPKLKLPKLKKVEI